MDQIGIYGSATYATPEAVPEGRGMHIGFCEGFTRHLRAADETGRGGGGVVN